MRAQSANKTTHRRARRIRCSGCGQVPMNPIARAEVAMTWLLVGPDGPGRGALLPYVHTARV